MGSSPQLIAPDARGSNLFGVAALEEGPVSARRREFATKVTAASLVYIRHRPVADPRFRSRPGKGVKATFDSLGE